MTRIIVKDSRTIQLCKSGALVPEFVTNDAAQLEAINKHFHEHEYPRGIDRMLSFWRNADIENAALETCLQKLRKHQFSEVLGSCRV